jgi:hypothetical protein
MLFQEVLIEKIVCDKKTQTRRPIKEGEVLRRKELPLGGWKNLAVVQNGRTKIAVGRDYAVQPGRGKQGVLWHPDTKVTITQDAYELVVSRTGDTLTDGFVPLRIRVLSIRREDVRKISHNDAVAEGFSIGRMGFWKTWCGFYDPYILDLLNAEVYDNHARTLLNKRPDELYQAWAYTFEVV